MRIPGAWKQARQYGIARRAVCGACEEFRVSMIPARTFRLIVEGYVKIFRSGSGVAVPECGGRFTDYPPSPCRNNAL